MSAKSTHAHIPNTINEVQGVVFSKHFYLKSAAWWLTGTTLLLLPAGGERKAEVWGGGGGGGLPLSEEHMAKPTRVLIGDSSPSMADRVGSGELRRPSAV